MKRSLALLCVLFTVMTPVFATDMSRDIDAATARLMPKVIEWRRHIHQYPELGNREVRTAKYIEDHLRRPLRRRAGLLRRAGR